MVYKMNFKCCIGVFVFSVYLHIYGVNSFDELQFWKPDPKFDTRRNNEVRRNNDEHHQQLTVKRGTNSNTARIQEPIKKYPAKSTSNKTRKMVPSKHASYSQLRSQAEIKKNVSRVSNIPSNKTNGKVLLSLRSKIGRQEDEHKSTRIAGVDEPQTEKPGKQNKPSWWQLADNNNATANRFVLSPYSAGKQFNDLASAFPNANVTMEVIGRTAEYNDIILLKVSEKKEGRTYFRADDSKYVDDVSERKIIFIVHALSVMGVNSMLLFKYNDYTRKLLSYYFAHLDHFDIFLIPMANPDGFAYAVNRDQPWNKNMSPQSVCAGVALDRNFDVAWDASKKISSCSPQYPGESPFTEPETRAVRDVFHRYSHKIVAYMHLHPGSYNSDTFKGDAVLYPKGYTDVQSDDDKYIDLKGEIDEAMKNASFKFLTVAVDSLYNWYGTVLGTSVDYASRVYGIPYAMELVMQIYSNYREVSTEEDLENNALEEIWGRVIDVILNSIWKSLSANDV